MINVLHINHYDTLGGAAIAAYRLHQGLLAQGHESRLLVGEARTSNDQVAVIPRQHFWESKVTRLTRPLGLEQLHCLSSFAIPKHRFYQEAQVLNFHNLHNRYFNFLALPQLTATKPAVFTLHDMWSFTGHCAYSYDCERWKMGCGRCPYPHSEPAIARDNTHLEWKLKQWAYARSNLAIVVPSQWLAQTVQASMLNQFPIHIIPYGIDTDLYQPLDVDYCRYVLNIPQHKYVLMFGAISVGYRRKGGDLLVSSLKALPEALKAEIVLLIMGGWGESVAETLGIQTLNLGYISNDRLKAVCYSAADLFVFPTRADNLPLVIQESMACGTPVVSFAVGGVPELVRPNESGYLATLEDQTDFTQGIVQLLTDSKLRNHMSQQCREIVLHEYPIELQVKRYLTLYEQIV